MCRIFSALPSPKTQCKALFAISTLALLLSVNAFGQPLPLWIVRSTQGHRLYLFGTMHALRPQDYPLAPSITQAFNHSDKLVEEINLSRASPQRMRTLVFRLGVLPTGQTLSSVMGAKWNKAKMLARKDHVNLRRFAGLKPWLVAVTITFRAIARSGYRSALGADRHFFRIALRRKMPIDGLETVRQQLRYLALLPLPVQRSMLLQALEQTSSTGAQLRELQNAWRTGNVRSLEKITQRAYREFPLVKKVLLTDRNKRWVPQLRRCINSTTTCFVAVGIEHMVGPSGLIALLKQAGYKITQVQTEPPSKPAA